MCGFEMFVQLERDACVCDFVLKTWFKQHTDTHKHTHTYTPTHTDTHRHIGPCILNLAEKRSSVMTISGRSDSCSCSRLVANFCLQQHLSKGAVAVSQLPSILPSVPRESVYNLPMSAPSSCGKPCSMKTASHTKIVHTNNGIVPCCDADDLTELFSLFFQAR